MPLAGVPTGLPAGVAHALRTSDQPPGARTRAKMERRFGMDPGAVRVVNDSNAARSVGTLAAHAYTLGEKIVFGRGQYSPDTPAGELLIAHELTHVMQQREAGQATPSSTKQVEWGMRGAFEGGWTYDLYEYL